MIAPNKAIAVGESALGKATSVLQAGTAPIDLLRLYESVASEFDGIDQFLLTLDVLYVLGRIDIDLATRTVTYAA